MENSDAAPVMHSMLADAIGCNRRLMSWFENEFLDAPVQDFGDVELVFGGAGDFVNPAELAELFAGFAEDTENFSIKAEFIDAAWKTVGAEEDLVGAGGDANGPGRAGGHGAGGGGGLVADGGASIGIDGNIDGDDAKEFSISIEDLDAAVAAVRDVNIVVRIDRDAVRGVELAGLVAGFAPGFEPVAVLVDFGDAGIHVAVADVGVAGSVPRDVGDLAEHSIERRKRRLDVLERLGAFVGDPNVVVLVDFHGVSEGPGVEVVAYFAEKFSVGSEFEELRGACSIGRAGAVAAGEDEDVPLGIHGDARGFAKVEIGRKFQKVGDRVETDLGRLLGEK